MTGDFVVKNDLQRKMTITEKKNFIQMRGNFRQLNISGSICLDFFLLQKSNSFDNQISIKEEARF